MTDTHPADIELSIEIAAPIAKVWADMTQTDRVPLWLGCMEYEMKVGHVFYMQQDANKRTKGDISGATHCEILEISAPNRFVFSWFFPDMPKTTVTMSLTAMSENSTRVEFLHSGWNQFSGQEIISIRDALAGGWNSFVLPNLKKLSEG